MWSSYQALSSDPNLQQGGRMLAHEEALVHDAGPHLDMLSITSDPSLLAHTEAMEGSGKGGAAAAAKADVAKASQIEDEFNQTLAEYTSAYKQFTEDAMKNSASGGSSLHAGKVVDSGDGHYIYVNNHGFTHRYSTNAWEHKGNGCPSKAVPIDAEVLTKMKPGPSMNPGQPCGLEGKLVRNKGTREMAWVDMKGYKHSFSQDAWSHKSKSCEVEVHDIESASYEALPTGAAMEPGAPCSQGTVDAKAWDHLQKLNSKLVRLAGQLSQQLQKLQGEDKQLNSQMAKYQAKLTDYVSSLKGDKAHATTSRELENAVARSQSTRILASSRWYHYWAWVVTAVVVIALTARALSTDDPGAATTLIALVTLVVILYNVVRWLYERLVR